MFPTRARAIFSSRLRRQTAAPGGSGKFDMTTPAGKNNALLAAAAAVTLLGGTYYMGYWDTEKAKHEAPGSFKKE